MIVMTKIIVMLAIMVALIPAIFGFDVFGTFLSWLGTVMAIFLRMIVMDVIIAA